MVTDEQARLLRRKRMEVTQEAAAAAAGMSVRTARTWEKGPLPSETKKPRTWRTREDPLSGVWESEVVPLLSADERGVLEAQTVLAVLLKNHPDETERFSQSPGGPLHPVGRALRAAQRSHHQQPRIQRVGSHLQGPDDHRRGHRPPRPPLHHPRIHRRKLQGGDGKKVLCRARGRSGPVKQRPDLRAIRWYR